MSSIPKLGGSSGGGNSKTHSSILAWKIPERKEPGVAKESDTSQQLNNNHPLTRHIQQPVVLTVQVSCVFFVASLLFFELCLQLS